MLEGQIVINAVGSSNLGCSESSVSDARFRGNVVVENGVVLQVGSAIGGNAAEHHERKREQN
eukprot:1922086-Amphidinium_carterae.1